jgi:hypothetical protein
MTHLCVEVSCRLFSGLAKVLCSVVFSIVLDGSLYINLSTHNGMDLYDLNFSLVLLL